VRGAHDGGAAAAAVSAAIVVGLHRAADSGSRDTLPDLLGRHASMPVQPAGNPVTLTPGQILVMPPQTELRARPDSTLAMTPSGSWRVADPRMSALAARYGARCIGVVLSGRLDDGALGARAIKRARGRVIVQDPAERTHAGHARCSARNRQRRSGRTGAPDRAVVGRAGDGTRWCGPVAHAPARLGRIGPDEREVTVRDIDDDLRRNRLLAGLDDDERLGWHSCSSRSR